MSWTDNYNKVADSAPVVMDRVFNLTLCTTKAKSNVSRARKRAPDGTPAEIVRELERNYQFDLTRLGIASGAVSVGPGSIRGLVATGTDSLSTLQLTVVFALSLADVEA